MENIFILVKQTTDNGGRIRRENVCASQGFGVLEEKLFDMFNADKDIEVVDWDEISKLPAEIENKRDSTVFFIEKIKLI